MHYVIINAKEIQRLKESDCNLDSCQYNSTAESSHNNNTLTTGKIKDNCDKIKDSLLQQS